MGCVDLEIPVSDFLDHAEFLSIGGRDRRSDCCLLSHEDLLRLQPPSAVLPNGSCIPTGLRLRTSIGGSGSKGLKVRDFNVPPGEATSRARERLRNAADRPK